MRICVSACDREQEGWSAISFHLQPKLAGRNPLGGGLSSLLLTHTGPSPYSVSAGVCGRAAYMYVNEALQQCNYIGYCWVATAMGDALSDPRTPVRLPRLCERWLKQRETRREPVRPRSTQVLKYKFDGTAWVFPLYATFALAWHFQWRIGYKKKSFVFIWRLNLTNPVLCRRESTSRFESQTWRR